MFLNTNYHKRIIEAHKVDQDTGEPVGKTGFGLYRWIGEGEPTPTFGGRQGFHGVFADDPDGEVDGSLWEMVAEGTTDDMGAVIFEGLEFGWYMMVEAVPNPDYAEWWESAGSTWGRYLFKADKDSDVRQTQTYGNMAISLECNVSKATIDRTSAAFQSDERAPVRVDNVGKERYRYDVAFDAGSTNVRADQYAVVDPCRVRQPGNQARHAGDACSLWRHRRVGQRMVPDEHDRYVGRVLDRQRDRRQPPEPDGRRNRPHRHGRVAPLEGGASPPAPARASTSTARPRRRRIRHGNHARIRVGRGRVPHAAGHELPGVRNGAPGQQQRRGGHPQQRDEPYHPQLERRAGAVRRRA